MSIGEFAQRLDELGLACDVELRSGVPVLIVGDEEGAATVARSRREIVELAKATGFATAAVELTGDAALLRD